MGAVTKTVVGIFMMFMFLWGLFMSLAAAGVHNGYSLICLAVGWGPLALAIWLIRRGNVAGLRRFEAAMAAAGMRAGEGFAHYEDQSGVALDKEGKRILLMVRDVSKVYGYGDLRSWEIRVGGRAVAMVGGGMLAGVAAGAASMGAAQRAAAQTGLYLSVRDVQYPLWRVAMLNGGMRARWMEIMRQEVNEGGVEQ